MLGLVNAVLRCVLSRFLDLDRSSQLELSLWTGTLLVRNVRVREDVLRRREQAAGHEARHPRPAFPI